MQLPFIAKPTCFTSLLATGLAAFCLAGCASPASSSVVTSAPPLPSSSTAPVSSSVPPYRTGIDFATLRETNDDFIGWIELPGTVIDYPVMRGVDNSKYLRANINGEYDIDGTIFIDMDNEDDFSSPVTVAYGHYTPAETYFTQLHRYKDPAYFAKNRDVFIYMPEAQNRYEIVAAFTTDDASLMYNKDYSKQETMQGFIDWMQSKKAPDANLALEDVSVKDQLLVMSTCVQLVGGNNRYLVIARLAETVKSAPQP